MTEIGNEQAADLAALEAAAAEGGAPGVAVEQAPEVDQAEAWAMVPAMLGAALVMGFPELREVYSPEACRAWGSAMVPVAEKYGWSSESIGPEFVLVAASLPFVFGTVKAIKGRRQEKPAPRQDMPQASPGDAAGKAVVIGAAVAA